MKLIDTEEHTKIHSEKIVGYKKLTENQIETINELKKLGNQVGNALQTLKDSNSCDPRWLAEATTDLQKGFMSAVRSVAQPEFF